jgi:hypothetical protein
VINGGDFLDGTPVVDIKPYLPYFDAKPEASSGWLPEIPASPEIHIAWEETALEQLRILSCDFERDKQVIFETLALDPRTTSERPHCSPQLWKLYLLSYDIHWKMEERGVVKICSILSN